MADNQDTEFTLGTGKLLAFFFGMVVICGIFFSLGYGVGRNSTSAASTTVLDSSSLSTVQNSGAAKPSASKTISQADLAAMQAQSEQKACDPADATCVPATASTARTTTAQHAESTTAADATASK